MLTLGCKVNQFETQAMAGILGSHGHTQTPAGAGCDVVIINTCAVTLESARKSRQAIRRAKKNYPGALIAVCGCFSQLDSASAAALEADLVGGSGDRRAFVLEVEKAVAAREGRSATGEWERSLLSRSVPCSSRNSLVSKDRSRHIAALRPPVLFEELQPGGMEGRTRALLKIQDGCDNFCAYCIVPFLRGRPRSLPVGRAAEGARLLQEQGYKEIVVTGIELSGYGKDLDGKPAPEDVFQAIGAAAPDARIRLGSLDPGMVTGDFCDKICNIQNLCDHFHLSLQSGCDDTLRRMGRVYDSAGVMDAIISLRRKFHNCGITADLIAGFPGETDEQFEQSLSFIKRAAFSDMHIFPFSPRPGTVAANLPDQIAKPVRRVRAGMAMAAAEETAYLYRNSQVGKALEVLFERKRGGFWTGLSKNYLEVFVKDGGPKNSLRNVLITGFDNGIVLGEPLYQ